jgi:hypothetical protein
MRFDIGHIQYVAGEVEKLIISEAALKYGEAAVKYFNPTIERVDIQSHIDNSSELIDLIPVGFPVSMLRQHIGNDERLLWTVSITRSLTELTSIKNSEAGRSRSRNHATLAAIIRSYAQELIANESS